MVNMRRFLRNSLCFIVIVFLQAISFQSSALGQGKGTLTFSSSDKQTILMEVYVSQGCSSCPPAQTWLNTFVDDPRLWKGFIPVVFHVDYWNYLGWKDPLSLSAFSQRQRLYNAKGYVKSVYTPGFIVNGREWRGWFMRSMPVGNTKTGILKAQISSGTLTATYSENTNETLELNVAFLGFGITTDVTRGENSGKQLQEEFAVLLFEKHISENGQWRLPLPEKFIQTVPRYGLALWVTRKGDFIPLQATGGWLP